MQLDVGELSSFQGRRQHKIRGGGTKQKTETYGYNFRSLWHTTGSIIFLHRKPGALPLYSNYKKRRSVSWFRKSLCLCFVGRCREKNSQCRM